MARFKIAVLALLTVCGFLALVKASGGQNFPNCTEFGFTISQSCCCSNGCCKEAKAGEVVHVEGDNYRIVPSGQIVKRTGWSPDGRTIRCACDQINNVWTVFPGAFTRCLYLPMPNS